MLPSECRIYGTQICIPKVSEKSLKKKSRNNVMDLNEQLWYFIVISLSVALETYGSYLDYTENIEYIQQHAGYNILLQCDIKGLASEKNVAEAKIYWFFRQRRGKEVGDDSYQDWMLLPCEENFCKSDLLLRNVTEEYSGFYKCTNLPLEHKTGQSLNTHFVRTYQLEVKNKDIAIPKFIDGYPLNKTAVAGGQVVFQCRVQSEEHPTIKWFRRVTTSNPKRLIYTGGNGNIRAHIINYNDHTYELLNTAHEKYIGDDVYLSKIILNGVRLQDEGYYACAAISYHGYKIREAYLEVRKKENLEYWASYDGYEEAYTDPREFWILFLMPLGLALLPLMVWLSYLAYRRHLAHAEVKRKSNACFDDFTGDDNCVLRA